MERPAGVERPAVDAADRPATVLHIVAPAEWQAIDFISDLHLAADTPRAEAAFAAYLDGTTADAVFILGDLFEAWPGDDARFDAFEARCTAALRASSRRRFTAFMAGNRDFLVGPALLDECGVRQLDDPTAIEAFGQRALLSHGDAWCLADVDYLAVRAQVRSRPWQQAVLGRSLAERRALARQLRQQSEQQASRRAPADWADVERPLAQAWLAANGATLLIHGHTHRPVREDWGHGSGRVVLSDWSLDDGTRPDRADVLRWRASGLERLTPVEAASQTAAQTAAPAATSAAEPVIATDAAAVRAAVRAAGTAPGMADRHRPPIAPTFR